MKHYCIQESGSDHRKAMDEVNTIQFTQSVDKEDVIATIQLVGKNKKLVGVKIPLKELEEATKYLNE